jgi:hypothetical protein
LLLLQFLERAMGFEPNFARHASSAPFLRTFVPMERGTQRKHHTITRTFCGRLPIASAASRR